MNAPPSTDKFTNARGVSILELLIVIAMISVVTGFALTKVAEAGRASRAKTPRCNWLLISGRRGSTPFVTTFPRQRRWPLVSILNASS